MTSTLRRLATTIYDECRDFVVMFRAARRFRLDHGVARFEVNRQPCHTETRLVGVCGAHECVYITRIRGKGSCVLCQRTGLFYEGDGEHDYCRVTIH